MTINQERFSLPAQVMQFIVGKWISKPIYVAAQFGIADYLKDGPKHIDEIARHCNAHSPSLYRVMRALSSIGIFSESADGQFALTPMAELLRTGRLKAAASMFNSDWNDKAWGSIIESVKTGVPAFEIAHGIPFGPWLESHPHHAGVLHEANTVKAAGSHRAIVDVYDFSKISSLTDIGGGQGLLMAEILTAYPSLAGTIADRPSALTGAEQLLRKRGLDHRCQLVVCDFFKTIPAGSDAYFMSNILHDWPDELCIKLLKNCSGVMQPDGKLLIVEMLITPGNSPSVAKLLDLEMMVLTGGRERTLEELKVLLKTVDLNVSQIIPVKETLSIIECLKQ
jgi:hypothetical protein